jgi:quercetin dioxygenase-like cupin family protein
MNGKFIRSTEAIRETHDWGAVGVLIRPDNTGTDFVTVVEAEFLPGKGHNFHHHPNQQEVIYVLEGEIEQWLEDDKQDLKPGDALVIGKGVVHASFNDSDKPAKILAILTPCAGEQGFETVDVADEEPWKSLRQPPRSERNHA